MVSVVTTSPLNATTMVRAVGPADSVTASREELERALSLRGMRVYVPDNHRASLVASLAARGRHFPDLTNLLTGPMLDLDKVLANDRLNGLPVYNSEKRSFAFAG